MTRLTAFILMASLFPATGLQAQLEQVPLHEAWTFAEAGDTVFRAAIVPGTVHQDLMRHGTIPDPYVGMNVDSVHWVEERDWTYRCTFMPPAGLLDREHIELRFEGLDTFAEVLLNGRSLGLTDNMFRTWTFLVKDLLLSGENVLEVRFSSPVKEGTKRLKRYGLQLPADNDAGAVRVSPYVRKAAYHFGWDWAPRLVTSGIWRPVELVGWDRARIADVRHRQVFRGDTVQVITKVRVEGDASRAQLSVAVGGERSMEALKPGSDTLVLVNTLVGADRWEPNGSGEQHLLEVEVLLEHGDRLLDRRRSHIGLRSIELDQRPDSIGTPFTFVVNGRPTFMKGANLVPPDLLLPRAGDSTWVRLVRDMQRANMNMVRVWAGGVYPPEAFLNACDTAGILVWQDLQFANWVPWDDETYRANATAEVKEQVARISAHPCLALFCGNNELNVAWHNWGWQGTYGYEAADEERMEQAYADCFLRDLPGIVAARSDVPYVRTSPLSNWGNAEGLRHGSLHDWAVWHGDAPIATFGQAVGRFVSEYGFQSYPDSALLARFLNPEELHLGSPALKVRQRSYKGDAPILRAIREWLGMEPRSLGEFIRASQQVQAQAYAQAILAHRGAEPRCMGTLVWQLNDCWPGPSWSIVDFRGTWKPAMYGVQEAYR